MPNTLPQIPKEKSVDYLLEAAPDKAAEGDADGAGPLKVTGTLVYCIDISGSMASTTQISALQCKCEYLKLRPSQDR